MPHPHSPLARRARLCAAAWAAALLAAPAWAQTVYDTEGAYTYIVPANAIAIQVNVTGAEGGRGGSGGGATTGGLGGAGVSISARIGVTAGQTVNVLVGDGGRGGRDWNATALLARQGGAGGFGAAGDSAAQVAGGAGGNPGATGEGYWGGKGGSSGGFDGENGGHFTVDTHTDGAGAGGGGGMGGGGGGGGMGGFGLGNANGGGGGGGGGSSLLTVAGAFVRAGGGGGGSGAYHRPASQIYSAINVNGLTAPTAPATSLGDDPGCATEGNFTGAGGQAISLGAGHSSGGGGGGGGGGGYTAGSGGNAGNDSGSQAAIGGRGGTGCIRATSANPITDKALIPIAIQGLLADNRPPGTGRAGRVAITPVFPQAATYPITFVASPPEGGSGACDPASVEENGTSTCTATPNDGWHLTGISGCFGTASDASPYTTGEVTDACAVTATFAQDTAPATHPITTVAVPPEGGSVACDPNPVSAGATSTCTATPQAGWRLLSVSGCFNDAISNVSPYTTGPVTGACEVTGIFERNGTTPGGKVAAVPTLGEWALMLLGTLAAGLGLRRLRRRV